jgi:ureidoacrylate peracid hydrolase
MSDEPIHNIEIPADPEPITIDALKTALIIVDMQNAFVRRGGYFDLSGYDISRTERIIPSCRAIIQAARERGIKIIYLQMIREKNTAEKKLKESPAFYKSRIPSMVEKRPDIKDKIFFNGAWGSEIIEELKPDENDIIIKKQKYDGFIDTDLEGRLKNLGSQYLIFMGTATNICVESTIRHAFFLDYFSILVSDAVSQMGPDFIQESTIMNIQSTFGWVTNSERILSAFQG